MYQFCTVCNVYSDVNRAAWCVGWVAVGAAQQSMAWRMGSLRRKK